LPSLQFAGGKIRLREITVAFAVLRLKAVCLMLAVMLTGTFYSFLISTVVKFTPDFEAG
jgi:hypothetical protein